VVLWLEEQVATAGFVPSEVIAVHSSNSSAAPKMERGDRFDPQAVRATSRADSVRNLALLLVAV
jgi:hypothetical protein